MECELCAARGRIAELEKDKAPMLKPGDLVIFTEERASDSPLSGVVGVVITGKEPGMGGYDYRVVVADRDRGSGYCHSDSRYPGKPLRFVRACEIAPANN